MSGNGERARHDKHGRHGDDEHEQHAGNATVNHGPSESSGPQEPGHSDKKANTADRPSDSSPPGSPADPPTGPSGAPPEGDTPSEGDTPPEDDKPLEPVAGTHGKGPADGTPSDLGDPGDPDDSDDSNGPDDLSDPDAGAGPRSFGPEGFGSDELALRRLLHQAVEEIEPTDGTLDHLRRAVPARRARKRQAVVGMAAAALFLGTAVPALVHVSNVSSPDADPSVAAHASATEGGAGEGGRQTSAGSDSKESPKPSRSPEEEDKKEKPGKEETGGSSTPGAPPAPSSVSAPPCTPTQLTAAGGAGAPDTAGAVYGTFTITNVSVASCTVVGGGSVSPTAFGAADQSRIGTLLHAAGDSAVGLPDPSVYASSLVLPPSGSYYVKFAWVPSETCPTGGGTGGGEPSPDPSPTENPASESGGTSSEGTIGEEPQLTRVDGALDGSVSVSYTAEGGAPSTSATVSNACAGTVYRTGVLATP